MDDHHLTIDDRLTGISSARDHGEATGAHTDRRFEPVSPALLRAGNLVETPKPTGSRRGR
jgi:hypothetical protein